MSEKSNDVHNEFKRLKAWVIKCPIEAAMKIQELNTTLDKLDDEYQKDIASADGAKRSYKKQRDELKEENARLLKAEELVKKLHRSLGMSVTIDRQLWLETDRYTRALEGESK